MTSRSGQPTGDDDRTADTAGELRALRAEVARLAYLGDENAALRDALRDAEDANRRLRAHAAHVTDLLGEARRELRATWPAEHRDRAEGRGH